MKISIDTNEDSHEDIRKVIKMLQNLVGDSQEIFTNEPQAAQGSSPMANIFGDTAAASQSATAETSQEAQTEETSESTEDLFAELFSEEELKKMDAASIKEEEEKAEEEVKLKSKDKKYGIEFY